MDNASGGRGGPGGCAIVMLELDRQEWARQPRAGGSEVCPGGWVCGAGPAQPPLGLGGANLDTNFSKPGVTMKGGIKQSCKGDGRGHV